MAAHRMGRITAAACVGTVIEFYDFLIFGMATALVFGDVFFHAFGGTRGTLALGATFAAALLARPLGSVLFGHLGDRLGRKSTLVATMTLMGLSTFAIGLLPSYDTIGVAAPVLLVVLRFVQGLAVGGEWAGAALLVAEYAPPHRRGRYGMFPQLAAGFAGVLSALTFLAVFALTGNPATDPAFRSWGWRIPFLASILLLAVGLYVRLRLEETPVFRDAMLAAGPPPTPLRDAVRAQWRQILLVGGALAAPFACFYLATVFVAGYAGRNPQAIPPGALGHAPPTVLWATLAGACTLLVAIAVVAPASDRVGRRAVVLTGNCLAVGAGLAVFPVLDSGGTPGLFVGMCLLLGVMGVTLGPAAALLPELFATRYRYSAAGFAYNLAGILGGAVPVLAAPALLERAGSGAVGAYLAATAVLGVTCSRALPETRHVDLLRTGTPMPSTHTDPALYDVAVVGYGPVGMTMAALLGRQGHRVVVLERYPGLYHLPRAGAFDGETMRTWAALGIADILLPRVTAASGYDFQNGDGQVLLEFAAAGVGPSGWADQYVFFQPELESALDAACRALPGMDVRLGTTVTGLAERGEEVVVATDVGEFRARYVVACDGGKSFVREHLGIGQYDFEFSAPWLVCDFRLRRRTDLPTMRQICDPAGPTAVVALGPDHRRFAFMLPGSADFATESGPEQVWRRVGERLSPRDAELIRVATYTFRSLVADSWRRGRVFLAGDAAHQMPPFLGQGMCSGIRDAQNLAFKLDLVLRGRATDALLDTYEAEREPHVRWVVAKSVALGKVQTMRDPVAAAERDRRMLADRAAGRAPEPIRLPGLASGFLAARACPGRGDLSVQGVVDDGVRRDRLDAVVGPGFHLLVTADLLPGLEADGTLAACRATGVTVVGLADRPGRGGVLGDVDGTYRRWFAAYGAIAVAVRPDFYVYGTADTPAAVRELAHSLAGTQALAT